MKNQDYNVRAEAPREQDIQKTEEDVWVEELSKVEEPESPFLPERTIVQTPSNK